MPGRVRQPAPVCAPCGERPVSPACATAGLTAGRPLPNLPATRPAKRRCRLSALLPEPGAPERFALRIPVLATDIDANGHVNNVVYLRWVQDAATAHWCARTSEAEQLAVAWVVVRHEIDYRRAALPGDTIEALTWVGPASRHAYERNTELRRAADGELLARARTLWCPLDPATGRPCPLAEDLRRRFSIPGALELRREG